MDEENPKLPEDGNFVRKMGEWGSMKNAILGCGAAVIFGLVVLLMSIFSVTAPRAAEVSPPIGGEPAVVKVEYYLPYPGVLPDSPLYKLKAARDRIALWLIRDETKKAERELLYADKRINAAQALTEGNKTGLGVSTATKAEKYLESAVDRAVRLSGEGKDVKSLLGTLVKATAKHAEVLEGVNKKATGAEREAVGMAIKLNKTLQERTGQAVMEAK